MIIGYVLLHKDEDEREILIPVDDIRLVEEAEIVALPDSVSAVKTLVHIRYEDGSRIIYVKETMQKVIQRMEFAIGLARN
jgi:hypothetical protein